MENILTSKVITFALWGSDPIYTQGAIRNAQLGNELFPDWKCRFYVNNIPRNILESLRSIAEVVEMPAGNYRDYGRRAGGAQPENSMFWKIDTYFDKSVDVFLARDCDSRLSQKEKVAIDEWLESDKEFHIMRDHPADCSGTPILGSMWGIKTSLKLDMRKFIADFKNNKTNFVDQDFLRAYIYPLVKDNSMIHQGECCAQGCQVNKSDSFYWDDGKAEHRMFRQFPDKFSECIGIDYDANDVVSKQSMAWLKQWQQSGVYWWKK